MKQRIMTGTLAGIGFLVFLWLGDFWFTGLILVLALIGFHEFISIQPEQTRWYLSLIGYVGIIYLVLPWNEFASWPFFSEGLISFFNGLSNLSFEIIVWIFLFLFFLMTVLTKNKMNIVVISATFVGMIYIGVGFHYMIESRWMDNGLYWTLLLFFCIWLTDMGGYFAGRFFGKHLLWPAISPKKTIEGSIGGMLASTVAAMSFSFVNPELLPIHIAVILGLIISIVGQLGDLIQSAYKRVWNVKDTGTLLPGHGGILDRCDSWLIVFPFIHLLSLLP